MSALTALPSPKKHSSPKGSASRKTYRHEAFHDSSSSAPSSPSRRARTPKTATKDSQRSQQTTFGTFLEDNTPMDRNDEGEDPHDLAFPSSHMPRASMVDNLVMSLDQFSGASLAGPYKSKSKERGVDSERRSRGHTLSSSFSSDGDAHDMRALPSFPPTAPRMPRRNSLKYQKDLQKLPSIFGEDEDTVRVRVYEAQRAHGPVKGKSQAKTPRDVKSRSSSASSSVDLGHLAKFQGRLGPAGNRRSRSFDFGSIQRDQRRIELTDQVDVAPTPVIFPGPEAQNGPIVAGFSGSAPVRKNSTRSSKSTHVRKSRAGTLGTAAIKPKGHEALPPLPVARAGVGHGHNPADSRSGTTSPQEPAFSVRPGFFRRVFGSSKNAQLHAESLMNANSPSARPSQDRAHIPEAEANISGTPSSKLQKTAVRMSTDGSANKENLPTVSKKPSAFFRRRKKSISNAIPALLPLTLGADLKSDDDMKGQASPVSSLRAFMDPYLVSNSGPSTGHTRDGSNQGFSTPPTIPPPPFGLSNDQLVRPSLDHHGRNDSHGSSRAVHQTKQGSTLRIPHHDSFLADSSSTEEQSRRDQSTPASETGHSEVRSRIGDSGLTPSSTVSVVTHIPASSSLRPRVPDRSDSWNSERDGRAAPSPDAPFSSTMNNKRPTEGNLQGSSRASLKLETARMESKTSIHASASDASDYRSAPSTPLVVEPPASAIKGSPMVHVSHPSMSMGDSAGDRCKARKIFDNVDEELDQSVAGAWLGEAGTDRERVRNFYMDLFDFTHLNILSSLRNLCDRIVLKGETQQMDRMIDAFARRWCACNRDHGFKSNDVVHTICYSILLLNTDLHLADIGQKMTKSQFTRNALPPIKHAAESGSTSASAPSPTLATDEGPGPASIEHEQGQLRGPKRTTDRSNREDSTDVDLFPANGGPLIEAPYTGTDRGWETQVENVLKGFYTSISQEPLPLFGAPVEATPAPPQSNNLLSLGTNMLRRTPSTLSKAQSDTHRGRLGSDRSLGARWASKARSRPRLPSAPNFGSSRTSLDEQSSAWSPSMSSTWSKTSIGKTLTSMSVDSFGTEATHADYQSSIGFANALSQAIIRDDQFDVPLDEGIKAAPLLDDESLELCGAPWAKEGILKHKCHLEGVDKRSKDRNWNDCFAVIEKGWMRLFSFSMTAKSLRIKARNQRAGAVVGGGNWQDNAEEVWKFVLRHAIASALPPPGYSKTRPYVWALSLPTGAVHLFSVGTPDIVKEFVSTANFWSARLSKEPMMGGVSNMEYGWSDSIINRALVSSEPRATTSPRPSTQMSMRSSIDHGVAVKPKLPGDRAYINEWTPPQQSMFASQLLEIDQRKALQTYVKNVEEELQKHNELRGPMLLAFTSKHPNSVKAMTNWEKKSSYLLREIVKFRTYIDTLQNAQGTKERIYKMRRQEDEARQAEDDSRALGASMGIN